MSDLISAYLILIILCIVLFLLFNGVIYLILRPLVLWYFKVYSIMSELKENNELLREIRDELMKRNNQTPSYQQPKEDYSKYMPR